MPQKYSCWNNSFEVAQIALRAKIDLAHEEMLLTYT